MNKIIKVLLVAALAASASYIQAHTGKTTMAPRSAGVNLALENTAGWYEMIHRTGDGDRIGGNFQAAFFYSASTNDKELGKYFLINNKNTISFGINNPAAFNPAVPATLVAAQDVDAASFIHERGNTTANTAIANLTLKPKQDNVGVYLQYRQDFNKLLNGLYFSINLPVVNVSNDVRSSVVAAAGAPAAGTAITAANLASYLSGNFSQPAAGGNAQAKLEQALLLGRDSQTGIADIDIMLGYDFWNQESGHASINLGVTAPTGNIPNGKRVFQAIYGNGGHVGFGAGLDVGGRLWGDNDSNVKIHAALNYRYLFQSREKRTLGINNTTGALANFDYTQYALLIQANPADSKTVADRPLVPAANVLTQNVNVTPGSQLDAIIALGWNGGSFAFDLGYNLFYREADSVSRKDAYPDNIYFIANDSFDTASNVAASGVGTVVNAANLSTAAAANPSQFTNKIFGGFSWVAQWEMPVMFGAGAHYEFAENSSIENWGINVKVGVGF